MPLIIGCVRNRYEDRTIRTAAPVCLLLKLFSLVSTACLLQDTKISHVPDSVSAGNAVLN